MIGRSQESIPVPYLSENIHVWAGPVLPVQPPIVPTSLVVVVVVVVLVVVVVIVYVVVLLIYLWSLFI
jgi:hypothetical protein